MKESTKHYLYFLGVLIAAFFVYKEYTYEIPYNQDPFWHLLVPDTAPFNPSWIVLMIAALVLTLPLFFKRKIGFLGLGLFLALCLKPYFIPKYPTESQFVFFHERKNDMQQLVKKYKHHKDGIIETSDVTNLGFEQLQIQGDTYNFVVHSLLDYGSGFSYDEDGKLPEYTIAFSSIKGKIEKHWYYF